MEENEDTPVMIELTCFADNAAAAATALESLSRIMLGLTLDGLTVMMRSNIMEMHECEHDHSDTD